MKSLQYRQFVLATLLAILFVGQAVASAGMSCAHMMESMDDSTAVAHDNPHAHHMAMAAEEGNPEAFDSDCCPDCDCSLGNCFSPALTASSFSDASYAAVAPERYAVNRSLQVFSGLFRPPISL